MQRQKLKYKALLGMEGFKVLVHDLEYDAYDQVCKVYFERQTTIDKKTYKYKTRIKKIYLANEEFRFDFNWRGEPANGDFEVYSLKKSRSDMFYENDDN